MLSVKPGHKDLWYISVCIAIVSVKILDKKKQFMTFDVLVVGGGPSGIYVATHYALSGHRVCLIEASSYLGGTWRYDKDGKELVQHSFQIRFKDTIVDALFESLTGAPAQIDELENDGSLKDLFFASVSILDMVKLLPYVLEYAFIDKSGITVSQLMHKTKLSEGCQSFLNLASRIAEGPSQTCSFNSLLDLYGKFGLRKKYAMAAPRLWTDLVEPLRSAGVEIVTGDAAERFHRTSLTVELESGRVIEGEKLFLCVPPRSLYRILEASGYNGGFGASESWSSGASFHWENVTVQFKGNIITPTGVWWADTRAEAVAEDVGALYREPDSRFVISWMNKTVTRGECIEEILRKLTEKNGSDLAERVVAVGSTGDEHDEIFVGAYANQLLPYDRTIPNVFVAGPYTSSKTRVALAETAMYGAVEALHAAGEIVYADMGGASMVSVSVLTVVLALALLLLLFVT